MTLLFLPKRDSGLSGYSRESPLFNRYSEMFLLDLDGEDHNGNSKFEESFLYREYGMIVQQL